MRAERFLVCIIVLTCMLSMLAGFGRAAEPLKIGMVASLTGPLAESGLYQSQGAKLAAEEVNKMGGVLGRPIELIIEDDQTTNPGSVLAFSKLAGDKDVSALYLCSCRARVDYRAGLFRSDQSCAGRLFRSGCL